MKDCKLIRGGEAFHGKQDLDYFAGISAETASSEAICMHMVVMPPGAKAKAHYHAAHETAIYMLEGESEMLYGEKLDNVMRVKQGDYLYIPAMMPHQPYNPTDRTARAIIARTDPKEQESVVLL
jgi:uncharacterized RmlC-like cupin family protein